MALLSLQDVSISFGGSPVLDKVSMQAEEGERVCLHGRNGEGKTTLLKLISGEIKPDSGTIALQKGCSIAGLSQELPAERVRIKKEQPRKLTFREGKELEALTGLIELLEQEQKEL